LDKNTYEIRFCELISASLAAFGGFPPFGALRHHLPPAKAVGLWVLSNVPHNRGNIQPLKLPAKEGLLIFTSKAQPTYFSKHPRAIVKVFKKLAAKPPTTTL
jgi:hypothetical protein